MSARVITWIIAACAAFMGLIFFSKQVRAILSVIFRGIIGAACIYAANFLLGGLGLFVGVNAVTVLLVGLLGAPGFVTLYAACALLA
ncbi:MAG: pro-sigmaK processing inhibitor BofA family protein [Clostridiales bacterium]|jgi:pro-sigmaK processing inhibitor BofA|nr:pro-sigmaK processing inhibitor BofA family protein [Clostridiales bacterium]